MNARMDYLRRRREYLVSQSAAQRSEVALLGASLQQRLRVADAAYAAARSPLVLPLLAVAGVLLLRRTPRRKLWHWGGRLFAAWRLFRMARRRRE